MNGWHNYKDKVKNHYRFSKTEIRDLLITAFVLGFVVSFKEWGYGPSFSAAAGLKNWLGGFFLVALALWVHESAHKLIALYVNFESSFKLWTNGLVIALVLCFASRGSLWFLAAGAMSVTFLWRHRIGHFRYGLNVWEQGFVYVGGALGNVVLAAIFKIIATGSVIIPLGLPSPGFIEKAITINLVMAIVNLLPIPSMDGLIVFFASRGFYVFFVGCLVGYSVLVLLVGAYSLIITIASGVVLYLLFWWFFERKGVPH